MLLAGLDRMVAANAGDSVAVRADNARAIAEHIVVQEPRVTMNQRTVLAVAVSPKCWLDAILFYLLSQLV